MIYLAENRYFEFSDSNVLRTIGNWNRNTKYYYIELVIDMIHTYLTKRIGFSARSV